MFAALTPAAVACGCTPSRPSGGHSVVPVAFAPRHTKRREISSRASSCTSPASSHLVNKLRGSSNGVRGGGVRVGTSAKRNTRLTVCASANDGESSDSSGNPPKFAGAPMDLNSAHGQMLAHVMSNESHLFTAAVEATLEKLVDEIDVAEETTRVNNENNLVGDKNKKDAPDSTGGLVLFKRIAQMREMERRNVVQDVMYASILQKFQTLNVDMLPPIDDVNLPLKGVDLTQLTGGVHSDSALELVKEHLMGMIGPDANAAYSNTLVRTSKLQAAQMYAASIMFGYFLRKADRRFSLDRAMGTLPFSPLESAQTLEQLFNSASAMDSMDEADGVFNPGDFGGFAQDTDGKSDDTNNTADSSQTKSSHNPKSQTTLKQYIRGFDQARLAETARVVSLEGVVLAERQTGALFGSVEALALEMQSAIEQSDETITSAEELMRRVEDAVLTEKVKTVTLPVSAQRRVVLEAVAFGSFLRDAEQFVETKDGRLLTPAPMQQQPPGMLGGGDADGGAGV